MRVHGDIEKRTPFLSLSASRGVVKSHPMVSAFQFRKNVAKISLLPSINSPKDKTKEDDPFIVQSIEIHRSKQYDSESGRDLENYVSLSKCSQKQRNHNRLFAISNFWKIETFGPCHSLSVCV